MLEKLLKRRKEIKIRKLGMFKIVMGKELKNSQKEN